MTTSAFHRQRAIQAFFNASELTIVEAKGARDTKDARKRLIDEALDEWDLFRTLAAEERSDR